VQLVELGSGEGTHPPPSVSSFAPPRLSDERLRTAPAGHRPGVVPRLATTRAEYLGHQVRTMAALAGGRRAAPGKRQGVVPILPTTLPGHGRRNGPAATRGPLRAGERKGRSHHGERPNGSLFRELIGPTVQSVNAVLWDEWAEMSVTHRDVHDADVAALLHLLQQEAEVDRLRSEGQL
jgi:hypothetical protein